VTIRWRVARGDGENIGAVVARAGGDDAAIAEGRVFVGRRRAVRDTDTVNEGDVVVVGPRELERAPTITILAQDDDIVVADKPAGIPTIPDQRGAAHSLIALVARAMELPADFLHPSSRLDRDVSGVVVFAHTVKGTEKLANARANAGYRRGYVAIASKAPSPATGLWDENIGRAADPKLRRVDGRDAVDARTRYGVVACAGHTAMLAVSPETGRTHQIRVHAAHAGAPLLGDRAYGGARSTTLPNGRVVALERIALHCARVEVLGRVFVSPVPSDLTPIWRALGGDATAWDTAASCRLEPR
jgi:23S rRNA pseudouridine1911/1915/1917 synthase